MWSVFPAPQPQYWFWGNGQPLFEWRPESGYQGATDHVQETYGQYRGAGTLVSDMDCVGAVHLLIGGVCSAVRITLGERYSVLLESVTKPTAEHLPPLWGAAPGRSGYWQFSFLYNGYYVGTPQVLHFNAPLVSGQFGSPMRSICCGYFRDENGGLSMYAHTGVVGTGTTNDGTQLLYEPCAFGFGTADFRMSVNEADAIGGVSRITTTGTGPIISIAASRQEWLGQSNTYAPETGDQRRARFGTMVASLRHRSLNFGHPLVRDGKLIGGIANIDCGGHPEWTDWGVSAFPATVAGSPDEDTAFTKNASGLNSNLSEYTSTNSLTASVSIQVSAGTVVTTPASPQMTIPCSLAGTNNAYTGTANAFTAFSIGSLSVTGVNAIVGLGRIDTVGNQYATNQNDVTLGAVYRVLATLYLTGAGTPATLVQTISVDKFLTDSEAKAFLSGSALTIATGITIQATG